MNKSNPNDNSSKNISSTTVNNTNLQKSSDGKVIKVGYDGQVLKDSSNSAGDIIPHGKGVYCYENGDIFDGGWIHGRRSGVGSYKFANGDLYVGEWKKGFKEGKGSLKFINGDEYIGEWKENKRCGRGKYKSKDGTVFEVCIYVICNNRTVHDKNTHYLETHQI